MHKEMACKGELWFRGAPHDTEATQEVEGKPLWLVCPDPRADKETTPFQLGSKAFYMIQKNTNLIDNCPNNPFCDHLPHVAHKCSGDGAFLRFREQETTSLWSHFYF